MIVQTWNGSNINDGTTYVTFLNSPEYGNPTVQGNTIGRYGRFPLIGGISYPANTLILVTYLETDTAAARAALRTIFETESGEIKTLVFTTDDGTESYIQAVCEAHMEEDHERVVFQTVLRVHDDPDGRSTALNTDTENITATAQQWVIANDGDQIARPVIKVKPTSAISGASPYRRFVAAKWLGGNATNYPVDIVNNALDTQIASTNFYSATGADIRVRVNGVNVYFWLDDINTDNTSVWVNLDWQAAVSMTLASAVVASGTVETIDVNESISAMPPSGILLIDSEVFVYSAKNDQLRRFTIESRATKATSEAAHTATTAVHWIQHDIEITYGGSGVSAEVIDNRYKPIFELATSSNEVWDYNNFKDEARLRSGNWQQPPESFSNRLGLWQWTPYGDVQWANGNDGIQSDVDPWEVMGIYSYGDSSQPTLQWVLPCPCGIAEANFQNGYKRTEYTAMWVGRVRSSRGASYPWLTEYDIPTPGSTSTWLTWSQDVTTIQSGAKYLAMELRISTPAPEIAEQYLEVSDVTLTLDSSLTLTAYIAPETGNYTIDATLTNVTTGDILDIDFTLGVDETLVIDTETGEVTYEEEGTSEYQAVIRKPAPRLEWFPLDPGNNTMQWDETGVTGLDVTIEWRERRSA